MCDKLWKTYSNMVLPICYTKNTLISFDIGFHYYVLAEAFAFNMEMHQGDKHSIMPVLIAYYYLPFSRYHIPRSWLKASNNLLVLFEETGGNPFEISVKSRYTKTICAEVSETHYTSLQNWSHSDSIDKFFSQNTVTPEMHLQCDGEHTISSIEFASYGTPRGSCHMFSQGKCHAPNSTALVSKV